MDVDALNGVGIEVRHGTVLGMVSPNGAGKSTLLSILAGLIGLLAIQLLKARGQGE